ncbi:efflux transporter outer membrane subunit [Aquabacterium sp.]|uniref:efflux transporter outer membrane subunit n=1 Tax=Aquabacterium sp. TaxID=1872578 RepID=UPI0025BAD178|nr:efflux transporter outer membrane subunit [Aquabacterium sp.]
MSLVKNRGARAWLLSPIALALIACAQVAPVAPPRVEVPPAYKGAATPASRDESRISLNWWELYGDEELNRHQAELLERSPDLASALARHEQAQAAMSAVRSTQAPTVGVGLGAQRLRQSELRPLRVLGPNSPDRYNSATAELDLSYEVDLWGRVRQRVAAGEAELRAADADLQGARLSLQAQLADSWLALRGADAELSLLRETLTSYERAVELLDARHRQGISSGLDLARAQGQADATRSQLKQAQARRAVLEHSVAALIGANASTFSVAPRVVKFTTPAIPVGLPSELLERRPDIRAAKERVSAAAASVGVAKAAFFPALTLGAQGGFQSSDFSRFIEAPNLFWAIGPSLAVTLFDGGRRKAEQARTEAVLDEAGQRYRGVVLGAFQQVEDQLALLNNYADAAASEQAAAASANRALEMAESRYRGGAANYLDVLTAQTAQLLARRAELDLLTRQRRASVQLIRALGGGWSPGAEA